MNYKDLWTSHSHRINADDSEKYMDEEDFKIAILEWESAKTVSRVKLPVRVQIAEERENILLSDLVRHLRTDFEDGEIISYRIKVKQPFSTREIRYPGK